MKSWQHKWFYDKNHKLIIWQRPNLPLFVWVISSLLSHMAEGNIDTALRVVAFGALFTWAWLEAFSGVNYFRRTLGIIVLVSAILLATSHASI